MYIWFHIHSIYQQCHNSLHSMSHTPCLTTANYASYLPPKLPISIRAKVLIPASSGLCMARPLRNDHSEQFICAVFTLSGLCSSLEGTCSSDYCNSPYHTSKNNDLFLGHSKDLTRSWDHFHEVRHVLTGILFSIASTLFCPKRIQWEEIYFSIICHFL